MSSARHEGLLFSSRLQRRFFLVFLLVGFAPLLVIAYAGFRFADDALAREANRHLQSVADSRAQMIDAWYRERQADIAAIAQNLCVVTTCNKQGTPAGPYDSTCSLLDCIHHGSAAYQFIHIVNLENRVTAGIGEMPTNGLSPAERNLVEQLQLEKNKANAMTHVFHESGQLPYMLIGHRVVDESGLVIGAVTAHLSLPVTLDPLMTDATGLGETGETFLVDGKGYLISRSRFAAESIIGSRVINLATVQQCQREKSVAADYLNYRGRDVLGYCTWMPEHEWGLVAEICTDEIYRQIYFTRTAVLIIGFLLFLFIAFVSAGISRGLTKPILAVAAAAREVGEGDFTQRVSIRSKDEMGELAESFNEMVERLHNTQEDLSDKQRELRAAYNELVEAQDRLVQQERMAAIGQFTAGMVHEMRNPLSSIMMNLQILQKQLPENDKAARHMEIAIGGASRLERMFKDLLNFARPIEIVTRPTFLRPLIDEVIAGFAGTIDQRNIRVNVDMQPPDHQSDIDADRLRQVLINLIANAFEAMPDSGELTIVAQAKNERIDFSIRDTGIGITAEGQQRLFEPFFTSKDNGTGLGLLMTRKIVEAHGGTIEIDSEPQRGTTVRFFVLEGNP